MKASAIKILEIAGLVAFWLFWCSLALAQSTSFTTGISGIGQALGIGSQLMSLGMQGRMYQQQPNASYYAPGSPCFVHDGNRLVPGRFYPVQETNGRVNGSTCVETASPGQP